MSKVTIGVTAGVLAIGVAAFYFARKDGATAIPADIAAKSVVAPSHRIESTRADVVVAPAPTPPASADGNQVPAPPPLQNSMPVGPEFEELIKSNRLVAASHAAIEKEPRDPLWAAEMEDKFNQAFAANMDLRPYGVPSAECRSTRCEIRLLAYGAPHKESPEWARLLAQGISTKPDPKQGESASVKLLEASLATREIGGATALVYSIRYERGESRLQ